MRGKWKKDTSDKDLRNRRRQKHHTVCVFCTSSDWKGAVSRGDAQQRGLLWRTSRPLSLLMVVRQRRPLKTHAPRVRGSHSDKYSRVRHRDEEEDEPRLKWLKFSIWGLKSSPSRDEMQTKHPFGEKDTDDEILPLVGRDRSNHSAVWYPPFLLDAFYFKHTSKYCVSLCQRCRLSSRFRVSLCRFRALKHLLCKMLYVLDFTLQQSSETQFVSFLGVCESEYTTNFPQDAAKFLHFCGFNAITSSGSHTQNHSYFLWEWAQMVLM